MPDFTLVIPTYNRPRELSALLRHLAAHEVPWKIIILDSGPHSATIETTGLDGMVYLYGPDTHPFDKFREGLAHVTTEYCALCADDDMYIPSAVDACVQELKDRPRAVMATGQSFSYEMRNGLPEIGAAPHKITSIRDADPFMRLARLFQRYHALTYGVYRTLVLHEVLHKACAVPSILTRELLASALAAIAGEIIHLPQFAHGRSSGSPVQRYHNCHPTLWMLEDMDGMFREYVAFRGILVNAVWALDADVEADRQCVKNQLDLIFLAYLQATASVSYSVGDDNIHVKFEDRINDEGVPEFTVEEREYLRHAMREYKL